MIWLTWRQFRVQAVTAAAALVALAVTLAVTGPHITHLYDLNRVGSCQAAGNCGAAVTLFMRELSTSYVEGIYILGTAVVLFAPALIGIFWGAPLIAREVETGTFRLAWNQSVTRTRWTAVKLASVALASMAVAGLFSLMLSWWAGPATHAAGLLANGPGGYVASNRFAPTVFATTGITPMAYAAFAFVLGAAVGLLVRRTVPAMAITLAVFAAVQVVMPLWIRPHLITPARFARAFIPNNLAQITTSSDGHITVLDSTNVPGAWILSNHTVTTAGQTYTGPAPQSCLSQTGSMQACANALGGQHLRQVVSYQPAGRYWDFQWLEFGIFLALALLLAGAVLWLVRRRLS